MMSLLGWIVFGLIAGGIARLLHPGQDAMGTLGTLMLGVTGSLLGGGLAYVLKLGTSPYQPAGWIFSIIGAIILLAMGFFGSQTRSIP
ncbi:GlsB/YeaQ/YmgE family stress response membrane protein [Singulisphaera acidiphila]|uniref:Putative membrane protein n=1 Tax=Singulisphaera acidiphila (strain ATCC BAA-1392 / DSM 18658 / VKM B-2454 / MOB10) TaxID=886293 RepID=L0DNI3_SINAD|nr:GlsB/YeaQ/YmgE family stress response membrane protein [Singulisphaera acidiphila]AGA30393.1 putative membrane protein [Singulisphaera acidiphila DSM 18658]